MVLLFLFVMMLLFFLVCVVTTFLAIKKGKKTAIVFLMFDWNIQPPQTLIADSQKNKTSLRGRRICERVTYKQKTYRILRFFGCTVYLFDIKTAKIIKIKINELNPKPKRSWFCSPTTETAVPISTILTNNDFANLTQSRYIVLLISIKNIDELHDMLKNEFKNQFTVYTYDFEKLSFAPCDQKLSDLLYYAYYLHYNDVEVLTNKNLVFNFKAKSVRQKPGNFNKRTQIMWQHFGTEVNMNTNFLTAISLTSILPQSIAPSIKYPEHWGSYEQLHQQQRDVQTELHQQQPCLIQLSNDCQLYAQIFMSVWKTYPCNIGAIYINVNPYLFQSYYSYVMFQVQLCSPKRELRNQRHLKNCTEKYMWHGTSFESAQSILKHGFRNSHARFSCKGIFFASDASYSAQTTYAKPNKKTNSRYLILARVFVGQYKRNLYYGSRTVDKLTQLIHTFGDPNNAVQITDDRQAFPEFLIELKDGCVDDGY